MHFDHAVVVVANLQQAVADYSELGFTVAAGGEHADGRTHNALIPFADGTYIELIAFLPGVDAADHPWWPSAQAGGGLVDWALRTDVIEERVAALQMAGLPFEDPVANGRLRPDGVRLEWKGARPAPRLGLPFLIEDITPRSLRVPAGAATVHENGVRGVAAPVIAVSQLDVAARQYAILANRPAPDPMLDHFLQANVVNIPFAGVQIMLAAAADELLQARLARLGPGLYALYLRAEDPGGGWLDAERTHQARIRLDPA